MFSNHVQYIRARVCVCVCDTCLYAVMKCTCFSVHSLYGYWATGWTTRVSNPGRGKDFFFFFKNAHADSMAHVASCSIGTRVSFLGKKRPKSEADHSHYIVPMLRMSGCMPLLPLHAFTVCTDTIFTSYVWCQCLLLRPSSMMIVWVQWRTESGFGVFNPPPPKLRSFDKVEPDCKLSGKCLVFLFQHPNYFKNCWI